ncbi:hypothetical protein [Pseudomonas syringae]|uniref:hypothetical protein n=1 Tax=Pseudomonas syringae TaxID=317 RepID=UPI000209A026|nr:hypothetical protein [Pseudomonas syringae]EGH74182.1 hypothetical protein PSYAR_26879 [Pseudomonas syringae pv. aceris str. M302273]
MFVLGSKLSPRCIFFIFGLLVGCSEPDLESCADRGEGFFTKSINLYLSAHERSEDLGRFTYAGVARYDDRTNWWIVPFDLNGQRFQALLSCDGKLELSGRP